MTLQDQLDVAQVGAGRTGTVVVGVDAGDMSADGSTPSTRAAAYAAGLARAHGSALVAVWVRPRISLSDTIVEPVEVLVGENEHAAAALRETFERVVEGFGIADPRLVVLEGDPFECITELADEVGAEAIVVGASEHRLGSLAVHLVRAARWPVIVVP